MKVDPEEIKQKAGIVDGAASTAEGELASSLSGAESARPGFPGDAAAPFETVVSTFEPIDSTLVRNAHDIANAMSAVAGDRANKIYNSSAWRFNS